MKKQSFNGIALSESLYSFGRLETDSKVAHPNDFNNPDRLQTFLSIDFEAGRSMPRSPYEREKRILHRYPLSADEIQSERKKAARRCRV